MKHLNIILHAAAKKTITFIAAEGFLPCFCVFFVFSNFLPLLVPQGVYYSLNLEAFETNKRCVLADLF